MKIWISLSLLMLGSLSPFFLHGCGPGLRPSTCSTKSSWKTVDDWIPNPSTTIPGFTTGAAVDASNSVYTVTHFSLSAGIETYVRKGVLGGSSWSNVDLYRYGTGIGTLGYNIWVDPLQRIWVHGTFFDTAHNWYMRRSDDAGSNWTTVNTFQLTTGQSSRPWFNNTGILVDSEGNWFAGGEGASGGSTRWLLRKSTDNGSTWSVILSYQYATGFLSSPRSLTQDGNGHFYMTGTGFDATNRAHWIVLKSTDRGNTWATVEDHLQNDLYAATSKAIIALSDNSVLSSGTGEDGAGNVYWVIRRSTDNGTSWSDVYRSSETGSAQSDFLLDRRGYLYLGGSFGIPPNRIPVVLRSTDSGLSWSASDSLVGENYSSSAFRALTSGPDGAVYTIAQTVDASGISRVVTRKLDCW
jgi:hypothetical protein